MRKITEVFQRSGNSSTGISLVFDNLYILTVFRCNCYGKAKCPMGRCRWTWSCQGSVEGGSYSTYQVPTLVQRWELQICSFFFFFSENCFLAAILVFSNRVLSSSLFRMRKSESGDFFFLTLLVEQCCAVLFTAPAVILVFCHDCGVVYCTTIDKLLFWGRVLAVRLSFWNILCQKR